MPLSHVLRRLPRQPQAPATCSVHMHPRTPLLQCLTALGSCNTFRIFHLWAPQPVHRLHSESFGCFACNSPELRVIPAMSSCSVIHAELSSTPASGNNYGFDPVGLFVCLNALMDQTLSCWLPNLRWLGISGCIFRNSLCTGKHSLSQSRQRTPTHAFSSILSIILKPFYSL